ncbi:MAG: hypothetical protein C4547_07505 [Phycisphaerales bacterium]|nr:MAG: hypothetical protein C4547_07505 [Phycisphaerales bacterium]
MDDALRSGTLVAGAIAAGVLWVRLAPSGLTWAVIAASLSTLVAAAAVQFHRRHGGALEAAAWICAGLSVVWTALSCLLDMASRPHGDRGGGWRDARDVAGVASLATGLGGGIVLVTILAMRLIYHLIALFGGGLMPDHAQYGFRTQMLGPVGMLAAAAALSAAHTGQRLFVTVFFWLAVLAGTWISLSAPGSTTDPSLGRAHPALLFTAAAAALVMALTTFIDGRIHQYGRWRAALAPQRRAAPDPVAPGLPASLGAVAIAVVMIACYHMLVPAFAGSAGFRWTNAMLATVTLLCGCSLLYVTGRRWSRDLADIGMILVSFSLVSLAVTVAPDSGGPWADRYPAIFNAILIGLAAAAWMWSWLAAVWKQQLDDGRAWTTAGRMIPYAERISFMVACLALLTSALMAVWPRLPTIATMDNTFGRFTAGLAGDLFLLWVVLGCGRRVRRTTFQALAGLSLISLLAFVVIRAQPFMAR